MIRPIECFSKWILQSKSEAKGQDFLCTLVSNLEGIGSYSYAPRTSSALTLAVAFHFNPIVFTRLQVPLEIMINQSAQS